MLRTPPAAAALAVAVVAVAVLAAGCHRSSGTSNRTIRVGSDTVPVSRLVDAEVGLCQAAKAAPTDPVAARATFYDRSHDTLHTAARALETTDRALAARLLEAMQKVEADLEIRPPGLPDDLSQLFDVYRQGLARLAITAPPCDK